MPERDEPAELDLAELDRQWLAHELHDGPIQVVVGAKMCAEAIAATVAAGRPADPEALQELIQLLDRAVAGMRGLLGGLRPPEMDDADWHVALTRWASVARANRPVQIRLQLDPATAALDTRRQVLAFRIAQEAIGNALRHAAAEQITVAARRDGDRVVLSIEDDGRGFDPRRIPDDRFGVRGMAERARLLAGDVRVTSAVGTGTRVEATFPTTADS